MNETLFRANVLNLLSEHTEVTGTKLKKFEFKYGPRHMVATIEKYKEFAQLRIEYKNFHQFPKGPWEAYAKTLAHLNKKFKMVAFEVDEDDLVTASFTTLITREDYTKEVHDFICLEILHTVIDAKPTIDRLVKKFS